MTAVSDLVRLEAGSLAPDFTLTDQFGHPFTLSSTREKAIVTTSSSHIDLTDSSVTSAAEVAIDVDGSVELTLTSTKVQGTIGINSESNVKVKALKKTRIVGLTGPGIVATVNTEISLSDAAVEGATKGFKGGSNCKLKLAQGSRIAGKRGGVEVESNLSLEGTGGSIEGGAGAGILGTSNARIELRQGVLRGTPALAFTSKPSTIDLEGTRVEGEQKLSNR